jgi:hypothetical protein
VSSFSPRVRNGYTARRSHDRLRDERAERADEDGHLPIIIIKNWRRTWRHRLTIQA